MKKSAVIAGSLILIAAAYSGTAWYVGLEAEQTIRAAIERANQRIVKTLGPDAGTAGAVISIDEYQRGVFSSNARYTVAVQDGGERTEFAMQDHMQHGPFPWDLLRQGVFAPQLAYSRSQLVDTDTVRRWFDAARGAIPMKADTRIGFGGKGVTVWELAALEWAMDEDRLSYSGGRMEVRFDNEFRDSDGDGSLGTLNMVSQEDEGSVTVNDIRLQTRTRTAADEAVQVHSTLQAATLAVESLSAEAVTIDQPSVTLESTQTAELLDAALRYDFKRVLVGDIDLGSISLGGKVQRFNFEAISALLAEYETIANEHGAEEGEDFDLTEDDEARLFARLRPALAPSPELALDPVIWRNEKGETTLLLKAALQPLPEGAAVNEEVLSGGLRELRAELVLSRPMLLQAIARSAGSEEERQQIEMLAAMMFDSYVGRLEREGLVRRDGDRVIATIVYVDGAVDVNGTGMSVEEFIEAFGAFGL